MAVMTKVVSIDELKILESVRCREDNLYKKDHLRKLIEIVQDKRKTAAPAPVVFYDGKKYILSDGFYRVKAAILVGLTEIEVEIRPGGIKEAIKHSCMANNDKKYEDVLSRGHKCKRKTIRNWLKRVSNRNNTPELAKILGISIPTIVRERDRLKAEEAAKKRKGTKRDKIVPKKGRKKRTLTMAMKSAITATHAEARHQHNTRWNPKIKENILDAIAILHKAVEEEDFGFLEL